MPNWCFNKLMIKGGNVEQILSRNDSGDLVLNFEKILPTPEELQIADSSENLKALAVFFSEKFTDLPSEEHILFAKKHATAVWQMKAYCDLRGAWKEIERHKKATKPDEIDEMYNLGKRLVDNLKKYHAMTWYNWRCENWGTKWDCDDTKILDDHTVSFITAWCPPDGILLELSRQNPELTLTDEWWEEGGLEGIYVCRNGKVISDKSGYRQAE